MRLSPLSLVVAVVALALVPAAYGTPQDLRSPDARDANAAVHAQTLQDIAKGHDLRVSPMDNRKSLLAQEKYYSSYGKAAPVSSHTQATHDSSPLPAIGIGLGLIVLVAGSVAVAVRTHRRTVRLAV
jgi:hypothetical protein